MKKGHLFCILDYEKSFQVFFFSLSPGLKPTVAKHKSALTDLSNVNFFTTKMTWRTSWRIGFLWPWWTGTWLSEQQGRADVLALFKLPLFSSTGQHLPGYRVSCATLLVRDAELGQGASASCRRFTSSIAGKLFCFIKLYFVLCGDGMNSAVCQTPPSI